MAEALPVVGGPASATGDAPLPGMTEVHPAPAPVQPGITEVHPVAPEPVQPPRIDNPVQQGMMAARAAGYSWEEINTYVGQQAQAAVAAGYSNDEVAAYMGLKPDELTQLRQSIYANAADDPPKDTGAPWDQFTDSLVNYSGLGLLAHVDVPKPQAEADTWWGRLAQTGGQIVGSIPETVLGARVGATIGAFAGPWGAAAGGIIGAGVGMAADAWVRVTYADAMKNGQTTGAPNFADNAVGHAVDAVKEAAPAMAAMAIGGPAASATAPYIGTWVARFGARPAAELAAMAAASGVIQGKLPSWEETIDNAILLTAMHGSVAIAGGAKVAAAKVVDKLQDITVSNAASALVDNWAVTSESPAAATARIINDSKLDTLMAKAGAPALPAGGSWKPGFGPDAVKTEWAAQKMESQPPELRTSWFNAATTSGTKVANELLSKSGGGPARFNELFGAYLAKDFQVNPGKYGGDLDAYLRRFSSEPPPSPEMAAAAKLRMDDVQGKKVPPSVNIPASSASLGGIVRGVSQTVRTIFNPENLDARAKEAVAIIRQESGTAARATAQAAASLGADVRRPVAKLEDLGPLINYIEGRSKGALLPASYGKVQKAADVIKSIIDTRRKALKAQAKPSKGFIDEYWSHLWADKAKAREFLATKKDGQWPTVGEAMRAGLEPKMDPISAVMEYAAAMDRAIAMNGIRETAMDVGDWQHFKRGEQPAGWVELKGHNTEQVQSFEGADGKPATIIKHAYAPSGFATVYNNFVSKGVGDIGKEFDTAYEHVQRASNAVTALKLALSGYHAMTVTLRSFSNGMAQGIDELASGHPVMALKTFATLPVRPFWSGYRGLQLQKVYQGRATGTDQDQRIVDLITEANGRMAGNRHAIDVQFSQVGSYVTSLMRGTLGAELKADVKQTFTTPLGFAQVAARNVGRFMETVGQPLFQKYIPWLKNAATAEHVSSWLERNPGASHADALKATRYIVDQMDNRFGEMVHDNIFANKFVKQAGSLVFLSWSWTVGEDIRAMGGGAADMLKFTKNVATGRGPIEWTPKMSYLIAEPVVTALAGAMYQFLKTGSWPQSVLDFFGPKTGGMIDGKPERAQVPGVMKDVFAFWDHPTEEVWNKMSPFLHTVRELWTNKDWKEDPIAPINVPGYGMMDYIKEYAMHIAVGGGVPIAVSNFTDQPTGSNFSPIENLLGFRQPTPLLRDPEQHAAEKTYFSTRDWVSRLRADARAAARKEP